MVFLAFPSGVRRQSLENLGAQLHIVEFYPLIVPEYPKEELLDLKYLFAGHIVVDLEERIMGPTVLVLFLFAQVVSSNSSANARLGILLYTADADIENLELLLAATFVLVENLNTPRDMRDEAIVLTSIPFTVKSTPLDESEWTLLWHGGDSLKFTP